MACYEGNVGYMEVMMFFCMASKNDDHEIIDCVKALIEKDTPESTCEAWSIIQDYTGTKLIGKNF